MHKLSGFLKAPILAGIAQTHAKYANALFAGTTVDGIGGDSKKYEKLLFTKIENSTAKFGEYEPTHTHYLNIYAQINRF